MATLADSVTIVPLTGLSKDLGYRVPRALAPVIQVGSLVRIPLRSRTELGLVKALAAPSDFPFSGLRYLLDAVYPIPVLTPDLFPLAEWMAAYYATSQDSVFEGMIPAPVRRGKALKKRSYLRLKNQPESTVLETLRQRAPRQAELLRFLSGQLQPLPKALVLRRLKVSSASVAALVKKGWVEETHQVEERRAYDDELAEGEQVCGSGFVLTDEQECALDDINQTIETGEFRAHLLHGVTGSGKTEVYFQAIRRTLDKGGGCIYLVPEVALTPQTVGRMRARFEAVSGEKTVVWHSHLSEGERFDAWYALASGAARVVVGARSAIFAPIPNLRLIVVDEEHEPAYKQAEVPRYHGRDVAVYRSRICHCACVLGSATPALESMFNVEKGKYRLNRISRRVDDRKLPLIHLVDMRRETFRQRTGVIISELLAQKLRQRCDRREQSILFLNRRGYSSSMLCTECGYVASCEHCSVTLTYHLTGHRLLCHFCGFEQPFPRNCPKCHCQTIRRRGIGTERIEEIVRRLLGKAQVMRIDADAMVRRNRFRQILDDFRKGKIDVLVGTQMIAKGLDFPNVTLVGLVDADISLHLPDFRAAERTFQLLVQVAGRAGRGDRAGEVVVQTYLPHSPPIQFARRADFEDFLQVELEQRREFHYPPYRHLIQHVFRGRNPDKLAFFAERWVRELEKAAIADLEIRGPAPSPFEKIKDNYRYQVWYFVRNVTRAVSRLSGLRSSFKMDKDVIDVLDVDPIDLL